MRKNAPEAGKPYTAPFVTKIKANHAQFVTAILLSIFVALPFLPSLTFREASIRAHWIDKYISYLACESNSGNSSAMISNGIVESSGDNNRRHRKSVI